eukprot:TRINITY_DN1651_c0_g1_i2.p2 TRINITY_DN1651_c0_g1~~TRINITY_DN1651_c0_g1_i2.p2  ORF type:complete len:151 (-),score=29.19 TRINITY_DN1651_c0_g1_i2:1317-1769(-)
MGFGWNSAPWIFTIISRMVVWLARKRGIRILLLYIDDFLIVAQTYEEAVEARAILLQVLKDLGFTVAPDKCVGPTQQVIFLGILLDSITMKASLPPGRLEKLRELLSRWLDKKEAMVLEMQGLVGRLGSACKVVYGVERSSIDCWSYFVT